MTNTDEISDEISNESLWFTVRVVPTVGDDELDEEDLDVANDYAFDLPAEAQNWTQSRQAREVLDAFHNCIAISTLDHFDISVLNGEDQEIFDEEDDLD